MRRTDFCHLTFSYEHPRLVGSRRVMRFWRLHDRGDRLLHVQGDSLRWVTRSPFGAVVAGVVFPSRTRANRTSDTPVASLEVVMPLARACAVSKAAKITRLVPA